MAGYLNYQIWTRDIGAKDDVVREILASGTITTSTSLSSAVTIPYAPSGQQAVGLFSVYGSAQPVYVTVRKAGASAASGSGTHAASDAQPRLLIREADNTVAVLLPEGGTFAAVSAAAFP